MTYICNDCLATFDEPACYEEGFEHEFGVSRWTQWGCPECESPDFSEARACPKCSGNMRPNDHICLPCRKSLHERVCAFADELTAEEEEQLDDWLDGSYIGERKKWEV